MLIESVQDAIGLSGLTTVVSEVYEVEWYRKFGSKRASILGNWPVAKNLIARHVTENTVANTGKAGAANRLLSLASQPGFTYLANGSGTNSPATSDTALQTEHTGNGLARVTASSISSVDNGAGVNCKMQWDHTWTKTGAGSLQVSEAGIFSAATAGIMLSRVLIGPHTVGESQTLRVLWTNTLS